MLAPALAYAELYLDEVLHKPVGTAVGDCHGAIGCYVSANSGIAFWDDKTDNSRELSTPCCPAMPAIAQFIALSTTIRCLWLDQLDVEIILTILQNAERIELLNLALVCTAGRHLLGASHYRVCGG
jgi:hypothetical protein